MRQRLADRCRIRLGAATWRSLAVDLVPSAASVGAGALDRFVRPVTYQSLSDEWLPPALQAANPWNLFPSGQWRASIAWGHAMSLPLEGLLVADFSHVLAGPLRR